MKRVLNLCDPTLSVCDLIFSVCDSFSVFVTPFLPPTPSQACPGSDGTPPYSSENIELVMTVDVRLLARILSSLKSEMCHIPEVSQLLLLHNKLLQCSDIIAQMIRHKS